MGKKQSTGDHKLSPEQYKAIAAVVIELHEEQRIREIKQAVDARTHDVRLAMKNYRKFKIYCRNAVTDVRTARETLIQLMDEINSLDDELKVESIIRTKERTLVMVAHIDKMLAIYKQMCLITGDVNDERRWNILFDFYVNPTVKASAESLAEKYSVDRSTVFADISRACEEMGPLFFGIFGVK